MPEFGGVNSRVIVIPGSMSTIKKGTREKRNRLLL
jgi:hypothetical protein